MTIDEILEDAHRKMREIDEAKIREAEMKNKKLEQEYLKLKQENLKLKQDHKELKALAK